MGNGSTFGNLSTFRGGGLFCEQPTFSDTFWAIFGFSQIRKLQKMQCKKCIAKKAMQTDFITKKLQCKTSAMQNKMQCKKCNAKKYKNTMEKSALQKHGLHAGYKREKLQLGIGRKVGSKSRFRPKMNEDGTRRHENGCAGPKLSGQFEYKGPEARKAPKSENMEIQKTLCRRFVADFSPVFRVLWATLPN